MATETLAEKKSEAEAPAKEGDGDSVKETVSEAVLEKADSLSPESDSSEEKDEAKEEMEEKEEEKADKKRSGRKKSAEKEPVTPVSDRPTRERKKVERYSLPTPSRSSGSKSVSIEKGRGTMLREIPNVAYKLSKRKSDDNLLLLHTILYGKKAKAQMLKKNIGQFSGFVWSENEEEKQRARVKEKLEKCIKEKLIDFCDVLDIPINKSNVKKEELSVKLLEFLESPKATRDILLADREKKVKKRKGTSKNENSGEASDVATKRKRQLKTSGKKRSQPSETEEGKHEGDDDSEGTNDSHEEDDEPAKEENVDEDDIYEEAEEKKSSEKKSASKKTVKESSGTEHEDRAASAEDTPGKSSKGRKSKQIGKSTSSPTKKQKVEEDQKGQKQSSKMQAKESKDQGKKGEAEPTRKEMHAVVAKILKEVDFNTATLSDILRKLGKHFGVDLMHRKAEVKDIITEAINEMTDDEEDEEEEEERND